jgi:iron complex transport system ATP-binding protein
MSPARPPEGARTAAREREGTPGATLLSAHHIGARLGITPVLHDVSCQFRRGEWTAMVGPNGAGKSTLLRVLAGLLAPSAGQVQLVDKPLSAWSARERGQRLAWLSQHGESADEQTVRDVVRLGRLPHLGLLGTPDAQDEAIVERAMVQTECSVWSQRRMRALSGGERQRALLARALAVQAPVLLLDEPTTHLDPPHQVSLVRLLQKLAHDDGLAVVSVLHDLSLALQADRLLVMAAGRVQAEGPCADAQVRRALIDVFDGAVRIERVGQGLGAQWVAVPDLQHQPSSTRT